jgi:hypothetical protein
MLVLRNDATLEECRLTVGLTVGLARVKLEPNAW